MFRNSGIFRVTLLAAALAASLTACDSPFSSKAGSPAATAGPVGNTIVATVDGEPISAQEISPLLMSGMDRANAIDRAISRRIAANLAKKQYSQEVNNALRAVESEVGATVYIQRKMEEISKAVTQDDLKKRYDAVVKNEDFNGYRVSFALYPDEALAAAARTSAASGDKTANATFEPLAKDSTGKQIFVSRNDVPYNLGAFLSRLKPGEFTQPAVVRNGVIVLRVDEIKHNPKPEFEKVRDMLTRAIADERLAAGLDDARKAATIALH